MKILVGLPTTGMVHMEFMRSIIALHKPCELTYAFTQNSVIHDARNRFAKLAIEGDFDYLFMCDSDMVLPADTLNKLLAHGKEHGKDIVGGLCFKKRYPYTPCCNVKFAVFPDGEVLAEPLMEWDDNLTSVESIGAACLLIKTDVLRAIRGEWFDPYYEVAEDFMFCQRARVKGYDIWVDPTLIVPHIGTMQFTDEHYRKALQDAIQKDVGRLTQT